MVVLAFGVVLGACAASPTLTSTPSALPTTIAPPGGSPAAPASSGPTGSASIPASSPSGSVVVVDPSLVSFLPSSGQGLVRAIDPDTTLQVAQDPELRANATGLIIAIYTAAPSPGAASPTDGNDIAIVSVVRLRDPSVGDDWFRSWRDSYDAAACANAGGVSRNSQTDIGTHTVFIAACSGGSFTYHTRLANGAIVISITSIGGLHLGETVMQRLAP